MSQLAQLLDVHRATAARRLAAARDQLSEAMLARLKEDATLSRSAVRSALRLIQSRLDLSLERVMRKAQAK